jgi:hypothetical protein
MYNRYIHIWTFVATVSTTTPTMGKFGHLHNVDGIMWTPSVTLTFKVDNYGKTKYSYTNLGGLLLTQKPLINIDFFIIMDKLKIHTLS